MVQKRKATQEPVEEAPKRNTIQDDPAQEHRGFGRRSKVRTGGVLKEEYEVEYLMGARLDSQGKTQFLVKWKGTPVIPFDRLVLWVLDVCLTACISVCQAVCALVCRWVP